MKSQVYYLRTFKMNFKAHIVNKLLHKMLKNILIRRRESNTYLAIVSRHHQLMKATVRAETYNISFFFHPNPRTRMMSTDNSQVGVTLFPSS